jgi:hypothetical protein
VQALFDRGRVIAAHTCVAAATGIGGSAAARISVDHAAARTHVAKLGKALSWHGGLTLDYFWNDRDGPVYLECNPRTVEPGNAVASGVPIPQLQLALSLGETVDGRTVIGQSGVRTHSLMGICLGAAERRGRRRDVVAELARAIARRGVYHDSREILTPLQSDPPSALALAFVLSRVLAAPGSAARVASRSVAAYALSPAAVETIG